MLIKSDLLRDGVRRLRSIYGPTIIALAIIIIDHFLVVFVIEDLITTYTLTLTIAHLSGTSVIHTSLRSSLRRAMLMMHLLILRS